MENVTCVALPALTRYTQNAKSHRGKNPWRRWIVRRRCLNWHSTEAREADPGQHPGWQMEVIRAKGRLSGRQPEFSRRLVVSSIGAGAGLVSSGGDTWVSKTGDSSMIGGRCPMRNCR
jgi:hypothetical protein